MSPTSKYMRPNISEQTLLSYLQPGPLTKPFLSDEKLTKKISNAKTDVEKIGIIYKYIHTKKLFKQPQFASQEYKAEHKFNRTAEEIWASEKMTGCTDYAMVFATIARQHGIPTTFLATVEKDCAKSILKEEPLKMFAGHSFCECFADGKWILADPIACITETEYNPSHIQLTGKHAVGGKKEFIAYDRSLDIGHKQHQKDYNESMVKGVFNLFK